MHCELCRLHYHRRPLWTWSVFASAHGLLRLFNCWCELGLSNWSVGMTYSQFVSGLYVLMMILWEHAAKNVTTLIAIIQQRLQKGRTRTGWSSSLCSARKPGGLPVADQQSAFVARMWWNKLSLSRTTSTTASTFIFSTSPATNNQCQNRRR